MRTCPKCKKKLVADDGYCAGWCREIVMQPLSVKRGTDSQQRRVSRRREDQALEALVALALRNDTEPVTAAEIERYTRRPVRLSREDAAALKRARPKLLAALKCELRPDAKRLKSGWDKPANIRS